MTLELALGGGGRALVESSDGERVVLLSNAAAPPGATLEGALAGEDGRYAVKVQSCRREGERFRIQGRFLNLSRAQRARVTSG